VGFDDGKLTSNSYILDIMLLINVTKDPNTNEDIYSPAAMNGSLGQMEVIRVATRAITELSQVRMVLPKDLTRESVKRSIHTMLKEVLRRYNYSPPWLDPVDDMGIVDEPFRVLYNRFKDIRSKIDSSSFQVHPNKVAIMEVFTKKMELVEEAQLLRKEARESQTVAMREELVKMKRVLRKLDFISSEGVLGVKGRFSCELSIADEVVLTEMVFDGMFNDITVEQSVAILSCFVHTDAQQDSSISRIRSDMQSVFLKLQSIARNVAKTIIEAQLTCDEEEFVNSFNPDMIDVAYAWSSGAKFSEICRITDIFEGSIIRVLRRLEELMRQMASAAFAIGNTDLKKMFEQGANSIRRGVVFAASLYV
jgi:ATP-dependent RNA helicase DOB1